MKPLLVLLSVFATSLFATIIFHGKFGYALSGRIAMSMMLLFTAIGHFAFAEGMTLMVPPFVPMKTAFVYLTGVIEIAAVIGLFIS